MNIVFFDGHCGLCNAVVCWLMAIDKRGFLHFAPLQGETAAQKLSMDQRTFDTVIYLRGLETYERSTAVLKILSDIGGFWRGMARLFFWIPVGLRDALYQLVARNRFRLIKRRDECHVPTAEQRSRFLR